MKTDCDTLRESARDVFLAYFMQRFSTRCHEEQNVSHGLNVEQANKQLTLMCKSVYVDLINVRGKQWTEEFITDMKQEAHDMAATAACMALEDFDAITVDVRH